jgi:flavin reductase (DIM6/NTAB) family NADH-FMN oxidoreductase RutF
MNAKPIDRGAFRAVMGRFATGVTVVTVETGGEIFGMTANAFLSGSLEPPLCVVSVGNSARMHRHLLASEQFGISILTEEQTALANHFAGRAVPGLAPSFRRIEATPLLADAAASIVAARHDTAACGDHTLFIGRILALEASARRPLLYVDGRHGRLAPAAAGKSTEEPPDYW